MCLFGSGASGVQGGIDEVGGYDPEANTWDERDPDANPGNPKKNNKDPNAGGATGGHEQTYY